MDWLTAVVECVKALAWPIVVGTLVISQRESLGKLISGLKPKSAKGFGAEIDFEQKIDQVEDKVEAAREELTAPAKVEVYLGTAAEDVATAAAKVHEIQGRWETALATAFNTSHKPAFPTAEQIEQTWSRIDRLLEELLNEDDGLPPLHINPSVRRMLKMAREFDVIPETMIMAIQELYSLRNKVNHAGYDELTVDEVLRFDKSARTIEAMLQFSFDELKKKNMARKANNS